MYLGLDPRLDRRVAIYELAAGRLDESHVARLRHEIDVLAALNHPNIATAFGIETDGCASYLVMEHIEGPELGERVGAPLAFGEALAVCVQIARAVEAAHEAGIIHRGLRPASIRLGPGGRAKVLGFGAAREIPDAQMAGYMSPEQARGEVIDRRTDVFSLACIAFECLTGTRAFPERTAAEAINAILTIRPDLAMLPGSAPRGLIDALRAALEREVNQRSGSVAPLRRELEAALAAFSTAPPPRERDAAEMLISARPAAASIRPRPRPSTPLIGRADDVTRLAGVLGEHRLVSIIGAPGSGKSRVAAEIAASLARGGKGLVVHVDGHGLADVPSLMNAVVRRLAGEGDTAASLARAAERGLCVVLDGCDDSRESLMMVVHTVLRAGPKARMLVTSREPLNLPDEQAHRLGSLSMPRDDAPATEATLASHDATLLFVVRAQSVWPDFDLSERSCRDVIRIARRLGGIPMAIELAAARARLLGTERLLHTLEDALRPAAQETGGVLSRHAVVRVATEWSISMLSPREQLRLRQFASLPGGFTVEDAREASGDSSQSAAAAARDAVMTLESLCEKHLVMLGINDQGDECYAMHGLTRDVALRRGAR